MLNLPAVPVPITKIFSKNGVQLYVKREDLVHPAVSGNKFWKLFYNIKNYHAGKPKNPLIITFGGAYSNHIAAVAAIAQELKIPSVGIIRGEELRECFYKNDTLKTANARGMQFRFVTRAQYREKETLTAHLAQEFPTALILPEGGTNDLAIEGVQHMLNDETVNFNYLCCAVGTGGTLAGLLKYAAPSQKVVGFPVVADESLRSRIVQLSGKQDFALIDAHDGGYGIINKETVAFINEFYTSYGIPLEPIYTAKMMQKLLALIEDDFFPAESRVLAYHTGGLQGIAGANEVLKKKNQPLIAVDF